MPHKMPVRYAICGLSNRGLASFVLPLIGISGGRDSVLGYGSNTEDLSAYGTVCAIVDSDTRRAETFIERFLPAHHPTVAVYQPDEFEDMVDQVQPQRVIIASPDDSHERYILAALARGLDVISEKPMVTTAAGAARVLAAEKESTGSVQVTHNLRYTARHRQIKQLLLDEKIGRPLHISLNYFVNIQHGASYFLRWNRERSRSGGLSIHKSTHHLDLLNWWLEAEPEYVYSHGGRDFYGPDSPHRPYDAKGLPLTGAALRAADPYYRAQEGSGAFPADSHADRVGLYDLPYYEQYPGGQDKYLYDEEIDIEDHFAALVTYPDGVAASYAINFSAPWEGYRLIITGTHGQIETQTGRTSDGEPLPETEKLILRPLFSAAQTVTIERVLGGHEGADPLLRHDLFIGPTAQSQRLGLIASSRQGAIAVAAGEAIWRSIAAREPIDVRGLLR